VVNIAGAYTTFRTLTTSP